MYSRLQPVAVESRNVRVCNREKNVDALERFPRASDRPDFYVIVMRPVTSFGPSNKIIESSSFESRLPYYGSSFQSKNPLANKGSLTHRRV
jgi:hypothetical protein